VRFEWSQRSLNLRIYQYQCGRSFLQLSTNVCSGSLSDRPPAIGYINPDLALLHRPPEGEKNGPEAPTATR